MKKMITIVTVFLLFFTQVNAIDTQSHSWFFKPNNQSKPPELLSDTLEYFKNYKSIAIGDTERKKIYLTFDAGYENGNVKKIVDTLFEKKAPGAFFILPQLAKTNPELVKRMKEEGHLVCNHTKSHKDMSKITDFDSFSKQLIEAEDIIREYCGVELDKYYRPPEGRFSEQNLEYANKLGYTTVFWSLAYADWDNNKQVNPEKALELLCARTHNGCVLLLHPTSETNAKILGEYIDRMRGLGYEFSSLENIYEAEDI